MATADDRKEVMWRFPRRWCVRFFPQRALITSGAAPTTPPPQQQQQQQEAENAPHPILFNVPVMCRTVGRDAELLTLWQNLLSGRRFQAITGPDGIGKSTLAAEFCDRVRRSERFTCIHWLDAKDALPSTLMHFFQSMKGRKEKDVLLVIDGVQDPQAALRLIPEHANVYALLTTTADVDNSAKLGVLKALPLPPSAASQFPNILEAGDLASAAGEVLHAVGYVPLLMHMACCLMESEAIGQEELKHQLNAKGVLGDGVLSISHALNVLLDIVLDALETQNPGSTRHLLVLSFFDFSSISHAIVDAVFGDGEAEAFAMLAAGLGICEQRWDDTSLTIHPCVAQALRSRADDTCVAESAKVLQSLWPRRWRGAGSSVAQELVRHTRAICEGSDVRQLPFTDDLLLCLDRSATFLALIEGKDLPTAAELWLRVVEANQKIERRDTEAVRVGRECGRLLHFLRDDRAGAVLRYAFGLAREVHGKQSAEAALILGCYAPYLSTSRDAIRTLQEGTESLEKRVASVDAVLGKEEERMLHETIFVLLLRQGQMLQELGETVPPPLWDGLQRVEERIKSGRRPRPA
ncbi:hypothetical protein DQ04_13681010 [Trypanosoma grayi]|uniref:hypothetical protein n=1 Tax=Trypanosoma grayi TaxID=71804 RepID=UPI0004F45A2D|nr:hypothetical protein DQ04_13681010 [Trypanosoma grayi]KEG06489.1 hypothetical protein DQ04_13681010 [Trypanosoma grayi]